MSDKCQEIHEIFNNMKEFSFPFVSSEIPQNGIYILFEKDELFNGLKRIVRVGTHRGDNQLRSRLNQHFITENKDRSIFRKNIGRAILSVRNDPFLAQWELDLTSKANKEKYSSLVDFEKQKTIEREVTRYVQDNFSFVVFELLDKEKRLRMESRIISTVSNCCECKPSKNWLGLKSPKEKIRDSGLWLIQGLWKESLNESEFSELKNILI